MRLLVTGHKGYIGTAILPLFTAAGHEVVGLDNGLFDECTLGPLPPAAPEIAKDIRDVTARDLKGFDAVVHLAGLSNDPLGNLAPNLTMDINFHAALRFASLAKEAGVRRFLNSSSCSVYGASGDNIIDESGRLDPITPYGRSKVMLDEALGDLADGRFTPVYLRNATAYGFSPRPRLDLVLNDFVANALTQGRIEIKSDGTPWRPIVHIEDIGRAFVALLEAPAEVVGNQAFNIGVNEENYQIHELAEMVRQTVPGCTVAYAKDAGPDKRCYRVDCSKIRRLVPAFVPQWTARKGAEQMYAAFQAQGLTASDLESPRFRRLAHVRRLMEAGRLDAALHMTETARALGG